MPAPFIAFIGPDMSISYRSPYGPSLASVASAVSPESPLGELGQAAGVYPLLGIDEGRIFHRALSGGMSCLAGVVHIPQNQWLGKKPEDWPMECMMAGRLNDKLWIDIERAQPIARQMHHPEVVPELTVGGMLTSVQFRAGSLPDAIHVGLRETPMPDQRAHSRGGRWAIVFAGMNKRLEALPRDGVYELGSKGLTLVDDRGFNGSPIDSVLREPIWGPGGNMGLLTSMRHDFFPKWVKEDRKRNAKRDPRFGEFLELMKDVPKLPMVYTVEQHKEHERAARAVVQGIMARERIQEMSALAQAVGVKRAP